MKITKTTLILASYIVLLSSCTKDEVIDTQVDPVTNTAEILRSKILINLGQEIILPNNQLLKNKFTDLNVSTLNFTNVSNLSNLLILQDKWKIAQNQWEINCLYHLGPVRDQILFYKIDTWPSNLGFMNDILAGTDVIDDAYIESKGVTVKGLPAIENLVFDLDNGNQSVLDSFNTSNFQLRRKQYLNALTQNLNIQATKIDSIWDVNQGNYYQNFILSTENEIPGAFNVHLNNLIELLGNIIKTKLEKPMGISNGTIDLSSVESYNSENSLTNINQNLRSIKEGFNGSVNSLDNNVGIDDFLDAENAQLGSKMLSIAINEKIDSLELSLNQITSNSVSSAITNEPTKMNQLLDYFKELNDLMQFEAAAALDVIVTFSGNDGD